MKLLILSAEAAAAATTRQPCETCGGTGRRPVVNGLVRVDPTHLVPDKYVTDQEWPCPDCRMLLRFVPVDDTYTEGEHIQIAALCENCEGNGRGWPENPTMCGGVPCPICDGICPECLGAGPKVVATATVAQVLPIWPWDTTHHHNKAHVCVSRQAVVVFPPGWTKPGIDLSDHLPFVTFTPGGTTIELTDVVPA